MSKPSWITKVCGVLLLWATAAVALPAQTFTSLFSFDGTDGGQPHAGLVRATNGDLYGTTTKGSSVNDDAGTVFKITPRGTLTTLYTFCSQSGCRDGIYPDAGLVQATNGDLYGTTFEGGANGLGTAFKIAPSGSLTTLYSFCSLNDCADGYQPSAPLVQGTDRNF
jgi:uncharacterized repeat protein (TIGR03803 family)